MKMKLWWLNEFFQVSRLRQNWASNMYNPLLQHVSTNRNLYLNTEHPRIIYFRLNFINSDEELQKYGSMGKSQMKND